MTLSGCPPLILPRNLAELHALSDMFQALADPQRLWLVCSLASRSRAVTLTEASSCCGVHLSGVSRHLARLAAVGLVNSRKQGRQVLHRLDRDNLAQLLRETADWLQAGAPCCAAETEENP